MTVWQIDIQTREGQTDRESRRVVTEAREMGLADTAHVHATRGFLLEGDFERQALQTLTHDLLVDALTEEALVAPCAAAELDRAPWPDATLVYVLPLPGVMDPVAQSTEQALRRRGLPLSAARTYRRYWLRHVGTPGTADDREQVDRFASKLLFNASIEQVHYGPLQLDHLDASVAYSFQLQVVPLRHLDDDAALLQLSRDGQLSLSLDEMQTIRDHFRRLDRDPTDIELETIAQTWSEHCSHKTLAGRIRYTDEHGTRQFENMLKETIFAATQQIRRRLGDQDWCLSVFKDNAGVIAFDDEYCATFKVETHNHPSALEPYGGANTGLGGVLRDTLGTGLGAKPVASTDVFCFAPPDLLMEDLPAGVLHPRRVMKGVVAGVRDYGNRMGIPTVNGAVYFDRRYLGNPLVYCGSVGLLPRSAIHKEARAGDWIVSLGGKTGRDGIHGATFSSIELTSDSETLSGGAVQIGNAITEKMLMDVLLVARDRHLFSAVTDCGAGGFSSAVGEMGAETGAEVWLEKIPLKYDGLSYTEMWISEAQERMVLAVPPQHWEELMALCASEGVTATILGKFTDDRRLVLKFDEQVVGSLTMDFLHDGRPPVVREASYLPQPTCSASIPPLATPVTQTHGVQVRPAEAMLLQLLGSWNIASKHWIIRQYDHEVQGTSVIKPLVGLDGPGDAAVVRPRIDSRQGLVIACGMNPAYGDLDPYHMAACAIDEAIRNCVAVGADPERIAILDNFCWGNTQRPETLGSLVRAALGCHDVAIAFGTPFVSGKDSLNNEFSYDNAHGEKQTLTIPASLLISALGQVDDVRHCVTMDFKAADSDVYLIGITRPHLGGSHYTQLRSIDGGTVPRVDTELAKRVFAAVHRAIRAGIVRACHDLSEGGLAVAAAEMAFAGGCGLDMQLQPHHAATLLMDEGDQLDPAEAWLFSESPSRFLCEVPRDKELAFREAMADTPFCKVGRVTADRRLRVLVSDSQDSSVGAESTGLIMMDIDIDQLRAAWIQPLDLKA